MPARRGRPLVYWAAMKLLAERLLGSLDDLAEAEIEDLWLDEAERRKREWDAGEVEGLPADHVLRERRSESK